MNHYATNVSPTDVAAPNDLSRRQPRQSRLGGEEMVESVPLSDVSSGLERAA